MLSFSCLYPFQETGSALIAVVFPATEEVGGSSSHLQSWNWQILTLGVSGSWEEKANKRLSSLLTIRKEIGVRTVFPSGQGSGVRNKTLLFWHGQLGWSRN